MPPRGPRLLPADGIVLLFTVDAMRADILHEERLEPQLSHLNELRRQSVDFTEARAPASSTTASISSLFTGRYYSSLRWVMPGGSMRLNIAPMHDPSPRFPEILTRAGVHTVTYTGMPGLVNQWGIVRGFEEDRLVSANRFANAGQLLVALRRRIAAGVVGPLFAYVHMTDAHSPAPYYPGLTYIDQQIGILLRFLADQHLDERTAIIVSADHGEAFGEHGTYHHAVTVYDELLRVPLIMKVPGVAPRTVSTPVSLIDVGPTILDLFGQPTPGTFMGESLTGFLGPSTPPKLTRPIASESSRWMETIVFPDGWKAIVDPYRNTFELYDLNGDPGELVNRAGDPSAEERFETVQAFFEANRFRWPGYAMPYYAR